MGAARRRGELEAEGWDQSRGCHWDRETGEVLGDQ